MKDSSPIETYSVIIISAAEARKQTAAIEHEIVCTQVNEILKDIDTAIKKHIKSAEQGFVYYISKTHGIFKSAGFWIESQKEVINVLQQNGYDVLNLPEHGGFNLTENRDEWFIRINWTGN